MSEAWGASFIKLDEKNRVILPSKARPALADGVYLTRGQEQCVYLFSRPQFDAHKEKNRQETAPGVPLRAFERVFFSSVVTQDLDKQGRITVPALLREYAGLERELVVIGMDDRMEIWDAGRWQAYLDQYLEQYSWPDEVVP
ncbi:MAG: division/cell wall cluster transcriptional repressor MraZ [Bifidobacteriaceae bacterium]|nr:division/cell wall cluster transcriptional repressor MraZ [Bifidobacteriaceae bacterium]